VNKLIADAARRGEKVAIGDWTVRKEFTFAGETVAAVWTLVLNENGPRRRRKSNAVLAP